MKRTDDEILDGVSNDKGFVGIIATEMRKLGAKVTHVVLSDSENNPEAIIVVAVGRENIATLDAAIRAMDDDSRPARRARKGRGK